AGQLIRGVLANREKLDTILRDASEHWKLEQMAKVDRVILRIAVWELTVDRQVPTKAAINESIELAKTFSGEAAGRLVNGILGQGAPSQPARARGPGRHAEQPQRDRHGPDHRDR